MIGQQFAQVVANRRRRAFPSGTEDEMLAGYTKLDKRDLFLHSHIGEWIILTWRDDLFRPPMQKVYGSHLATFIHCPHGSEIRGLNFSWLYCEKDNRVFRVGDPLTGINAIWLFKYSTLRQFEVEIAALSPSDVSFLQLPNLDQDLHADLSKEVRQIRADSRLQSFRHPGYPDDVAAVCGPSFEIPDSSVKIELEQVWVRITGRIGDNQFVGEMLNQPSFHNWKKGQVVNVHLLKAAGGDILVCGIAPEAPFSQL